MKLQSISEKLSDLNWRRNNEYISTHDDNNSRPAIFAFNGDVYGGIDAKTLSNEKIYDLQKSLRILSGFYGVLKPLDLIQPYRLEMGTKLKTEKGDSLYDFWGEKIPSSILRELSAHKNQTIINLASAEYFKAVAQIISKARVVTPVFKDYSKGTFKIISFFAKKARGTMASFIIQNRITSPNGIKNFAEDGYLFNESLSSEREWIFTRKSS